MLVVVWFLFHRFLSDRNNMASHSAYLDRTSLLIDTDIAKILVVTLLCSALLFLTLFKPTGFKTSLKSYEQLYLLWGFFFIFAPTILF